ncbi:hypothetical protein [Rubellicoccus peritrichatus]|uniref:Tetratricopeptide repeat protein n=1 Tax=Rubellicoccus peritrichatus TaxID=3080537 RepID=A0AAQ3QXL7_9BACT|nr:hypothetical protein [Puniceicoccus sp. CR14]WOO43172.1 hypothetical protein RZN69_08705 [Puniceicoccus sp. CR14]
MIPIWLKWALLISASGAMGGLIAATLYAVRLAFEQVPDFKKDAVEWKSFQNTCKRIQSPWFFVGKALVGIGGAFAAILGGIWIGKISFDTSTENILVMISLSIVAGTVAHKLVPGIGRRLEQDLLKGQINNASEAANEAREIAGQAKEDNLRVKDYFESMSFAETALGRSSAFDIDPAIEHLKAIQGEYPFDRVLHIYLGRLYRRKGDWDNAIHVLKKYIDNSNSKDNPDDNIQRKINIADAYYNIACYHALKAKEMSQKSLKDEVYRLEQETIVLLKQAFEGNPANKDASIEDSDLEFVSEILETEFGLKHAKN